MSTTVRRSPVRVCVDSPRPNPHLPNERSVRVDMTDPVGSQGRRPPFPRSTPDPPGRLSDTTNWGRPCVRCRSSGHTIPALVA